MKTRCILTIALCGIIMMLYGQPQADTWKQWSSLIGDWKGEGSGQPGQGGGTFSFKPDLDNNILVRKNHSEYPAMENNPEIIHDDLMIIYPDNNGSPVNAIYFDNEGHVINYTITYPDNAIILTSEKIQGMPTFRLSYIFLDKETVSVKFELSQDSEKFTTYIEGKSKRVNN